MSVNVSYYLLAAIAILLWTYNRLDWEAAGLMIFRLAYENCGLNPAKPDFFGRLRLS